MTDRIAASFQALMGQASNTAAEYLGSAQRHIDERFGDGFAKANPSLTAAFMQVAAADFGTGANGKLLGSALDGIAEALEEIAKSLRERK